MSMGQNSTDRRKPEQLVFHPQRIEEYNIPAQFGAGQIAGQFGVRPQHKTYLCGSCGSSTNGRVLCDVTRAADGVVHQWCLCACELHEPTIISEKDGQVISQMPMAVEFTPDRSWPEELAIVFGEASKAFAGGAFTSSSLVCRKILMSCACFQQEQRNENVKEGESFEYYIEYLSKNDLSSPGAKTALNAIRRIGNDATHHIQVISKEEAYRSLRIVHLMLNTIYALANA